MFFDDDINDNDDDCAWDQYTSSIKPNKSYKKFAPPKQPPKPWTLPFPQRSLNKRKHEDTFSEFETYFTKISVQKFPVKVFRHKHFEGRLDLHGLTVKEADTTLMRFFTQMQNQRKSYVLVITGKGKSQGSFGVLQQFLPQWLEEHPQYVVGYTHAKPEDGGAGALYVQVRQR